MQVLRHSCLYETVPAYVADQPNFLNAALLARSELPPLELLRLLKDVETAAGRDQSGGVRYGPRPLDLDIVFYGGLRLKHERLELPHPRWQERPFVQAPVADLYREDQDPSSQPQAGNVSGTSSSSGSVTGTHGQQPVAEEPSTSAAAEGTSVLPSLRHVHRIWSRGGGAAAAPPAPTSGAPVPTPSLPAGQGEVMRRVTPLPAVGGGGGQTPRLLKWGARTYVMAVLNATPDSFSDGGALMAGGLEGALATARQLVRDGADFLDVGGQSTRPGAARVSASEEAARVVPLIRALRADPALKDAIVSVDTFYASVARAAVAAGAHVVNDVSGGSLDPDMFAEVADLGVPYVLMHMRGDPATMQQPHNVTYGCTWREVGAELQARADAAMAAGVAAWNIVLDPGIGFSKTQDGNLELMRHLGDMRRHALQGGFQHGPLLVGPSRKGFLGRLTGRKEPAERDAATMACAVACVAGGGLADIVRAHNVRDVGDGLKVADALYRA